ncbi:hypothetical protein bwei_1838 [Bacillus mycoides]|uniref:Uncharacterized protein n=1 Tax=Bacillus mycoides TaxID=1405 RepID=A0A654BSN0_BACMY|nr:hypothetical protein bwei_1838 [Bacillus mycoides]VXC83404.1 conserved hypothetical protein [Bacillus mycoides]
MPPQCIYCMVPVLPPSSFASQANLINKIQGKTFILCMKGSFN